MSKHPLAIRGVIIFPIFLSIFLFFWYVKGQFDVWGTFPRDDISPSEPVSSFSGCDADLLHAARTLLCVSYVVIALTCVSGCVMVTLIARGVHDQVAEQVRAARAAAAEDVD